MAAVLGLPAHAYGRIRLDRGALAEIRLDTGPSASWSAPTCAPVAQVAGDDARHPTTDRVREDRHEDGGGWGRAAAN